ncbi:MAG: TIGR02757 family protein [Proteobacteria bacterium]|nr:TIGR02757 family protein [Pseudomonadota bacterium]
MNNDPVEFMHRYENVIDKEIAGFLASQFAYGKIDIFKRFLTSIFEHMGINLLTFIKKGDFSGFDGLYYRFQKDKDIIDLFNVLKRIIDEFGSIGNMIRHFYKGNTRETLWKAREHYFENNNELTFFFPKPLKSNPLKRWNLYFRWMVRKDEVDSGLWDFIDKKNLIIPLDTHIFKISKCLGWTGCKTPTYRAAKEITEVLKEFSPDDPLKYDLLLCHMVGIKAECTGNKTAECRNKCIVY